MEVAKRTTRASLLMESRMPKKTRNKKKVKSDKLQIKNSTKKVSSSAEDGGLEMVFSPQTPSYILKPRHPLPQSWTFWYSAGNKKLSWRQNQIKISTVSTIEDFWFIFNQVQPASCLQAGHTYSVFRGDILPDWEHEENRDGGRWMVSVDKAQRQEMLDSRWLEVLIMLMGEHVGQTGSKLITGAEVCVRKKGDRLEVWVGDVDMGGIVEVGREVKRKLGLGSKDKIQFSIHKEEMGEDRILMEHYS